MIPNKGRYLDCNEISQPLGTWRAGKNFVVNGKKAAFVNEPGTDLTATEFPFDIAKPIGAVVFPNGSYVVMADGINGGKDRMGVVEPDGVYTDLIVDDTLNFKSADITDSGSFPIRSSEIDYNNFVQRIIGFTDKYNTFRVINIDELPFALNPDLSLVDPANITDIEAFPKLKIPQIEFIINQIGGALPAGAYSACVAYEGYDGTRTPNSPPIKTILIADDSTSVGYDKFDGIAPGTQTSKSITFNFSNVDTRYDKLVLIIVRKVDNQTETIEAKKIDIAGATATITYLGTETTTTLPIEEVLTTRPLYKTVGCCAQINSQLYLGNLTAEEDIEYQVYANNVKIFYNTKQINIQNIYDSQKHELPAGFAHGGVYAFYIAFVLKNGSWSRAFHIPGRTALPGGTHDVITILAKPVNIVSPYEPSVFPAPGGWDPGIFSQANFDNSSGFITTTIQFNGSTLYPGVNIVVAVTTSYAIFQHTFIGNEVTSVNETITTTVTTAGDVGASTLAVAAGLPADTKTYQIEDTTNKPLPSYILDGDTNVISTLGGLTNMGYWENQHELYPANFPGGLSGHIRHHVFPTIRKCKELHYSGVPGYGRDQFDVLGIDVSNVVIPSDLEEKIEGWGIFYAKREYNNSNTLGTDLYLVAHKTLMDGNIIWSAGGNWRQQAFEGGGGGWGGDSVFVPHTDFLRGHSFELLKDKPALSASSMYLDFELKLRKENLCDDFMVVGKAGGNIAKSGDGVGQNAGVVIDETDIQHVIVTIPPAPLLKAVIDFKYYPSNIIDGNIRTMKNEEAIHLRIHQGDVVTYTQGETKVHSSGHYGVPFMQPNVANGTEETYLMTYKQVKTDVFSEFNNQILTLTDIIALPTETSRRKIRGGDTWASVRSFLCISPRHGEDFEQENGTTVVRAHITEGRYNVGMRHEVVGDVTTKYYPKTPAQNFWDNPSDPDDSNDNDMIFDRTINPNGLAYSNDYNSTNTYSQLITYTTNQRLTNKFPFRVIRGGTTSGARSDINGWKTFLAADYYESNRNRGEITDLFVLDDNLFIHHYYGLFRTLGTERLSLATTEVYLGTGDIFSQRPKEPISTESGYLGNQNIFSGVTFKGQRFWVDQSQGRVFVLSKNGVNELSDNGMFQFFRDNLKINNTYPDSPIDGEGIIATYDAKFDRIILVKKSNENAFTLSYSTDKEQGFWCFNHDYTPDYLFHTTTDFYGFKNNKIHKFNSLTNKAKYFEGNPQNSEIELIFNQSSEQHKEFFNINWISEVIDQAGILLKNKTLTAVRVRTSYQDSGEVTLVPFTTYGAKHNIRRFKNTWNFNRFKDVNADPYKKKAMMDNWCSITFIFNNTPNLDASQNSLYLYLLNAKALLAPEL